MVIVLSNNSCSSDTLACQAGSLSDSQVFKVDCPLLPCCLYEDSIHCLCPFHSWSGSPVGPVFLLCFQAVSPVSQYHLKNSESPSPPKQPQGTDS